MHGTEPGVRRVAATLLEFPPLEGLGKAWGCWGFRPSVPSSDPGTVRPLCSRLEEG